MEAIRLRATCPRLVFANSIAVFGGASMAPIVGDTAKLTPQTTYGMTKAISELLINDYSRRSFLDGRSARLTHAIIRHGKPKAADMIRALSVYDKNRTLGKITFEPDPFVVDILNTWPLDAEWERARKLNFPIDSGLQEIISQLLGDYLDV